MSIVFFQRDPFMVTDSHVKNKKKRSPLRGLVIREVELDDLPAVYSLGERLFTAEEVPNLYRTWDEYELVGSFSSDGEYCFVAELDDRIVGFALGSLIEKRRSAWTYGWLIWFGVEPDTKSMGVGTRLLNHLTQKFIEDGARMMIVDTDSDNHQALRFFRKHGFGDEIEHLYLSKNLTKHPRYVRRLIEQKKKKQVARTGGRRRG